MGIYNKDYLLEYRQADNSKLTIPKWLVENNINNPQKLYEVVTSTIETKDTEVLQAPIDTILNGYGDSHDQAWLMEIALKKLGFKAYRIFMIEFKEWKKTFGKAHTLCYYENNKGKGYWIETAWEKELGIHKEDKFPPVGICWQAYKAWEWTPGFENILIEEGTIKVCTPGMSKNDYYISQHPEYKMNIWRKDPNKKREDRRR